MEEIYMAIHKTHSTEYASNHGCRTLFSKDRVEVAKLFQDGDWLIFKINGLQPVTSADVAVTVAD